MNRVFRSIALLSLAVAGTLLSSCASGSPVGPVKGVDDNHGLTSSMFRRVVDHEKDEWNTLNVWKRVADQPPTYVPRVTPRSLPLDDAHGTWFVDANDGWRFFCAQRRHA